MKSPIYKRFAGPVPNDSQRFHAVRLDRAKQLLETGDMPLKAISDFCGFENPNSLRKFFLKETGMTLSAWRSEHNK